MADINYMEQITNIAMEGIRKNFWEDIETYRRALELSGGNSDILAAKGIELCCRGNELWPDNAWMIDRTTLTVAMRRQFDSWGADFNEICKDGRLRYMTFTYVETDDE